STLKPLLDKSNLNDKGNYHLTSKLPNWLHINGLSMDHSHHHHSYQTTNGKRDMNFGGQSIHPTTPMLDQTDYTTIANEINIVSDMDTTQFDLLSQQQQQQQHSEYLKQQHHQVKQQNILENTIISKKMFIDRQIKKAKSLPGMLKGTALSNTNRTTPQQSNSNSAAIDTTAEHQQQERQMNGGTRTPFPEYHLILNQQSQTPGVQQSVQQVRPTEIRRPRVYFADYNKVNFYEDSSNDKQSGKHSKKQQKQSQHQAIVTIPTQTNLYRPSSRQIKTQQQQQLLCEQYDLTDNITVKKLDTIANQKEKLSPRTSSHLPEINQSINNDVSITEEKTDESNSNNTKKKFVLTREKPLVKLPPPAKKLGDPLKSPKTLYIEHNSSTELSRESNRHSPDYLQYAHDMCPQQPHHQRFDPSSVTAHSFVSNTNTNNPSDLSLSSSSRQRTLRNISLRQQFNNRSPMKNNSPSNRRSASLRHLMDDASSNEYIIKNGMATLNRSSEQTPEELHHTTAQHDYNTTNSHPITVFPPTVVPLQQQNRTSSSTLRRTYVIHFNSKNCIPQQQQQLTSLNDLQNLSTRQLLKSHLHESTEERFQNLLTVGRPSYVPSTDEQQRANDLVKSNYSSRQSKWNSTEKHNSNFRNKGLELHTDAVVV
ncbi:unnamed protein product, partial [Didymodactylos carnosus]